MIADNKESMRTPDLRNIKKYLLTGNGKSWLLERVKERTDELTEKESKDLLLLFSDIIVDWFQMQLTFNRNRVQNKSNMFHEMVDKGYRDLINKTNHETLRKLLDIWEDEFYDELIWKDEFYDEIMYGVDDELAE